MRREATPADCSVETKLIEDFWIVIRDAARQDLALPGVCRSFVALQLAQSFESAAFTEELGSGGEMLPAEEPAHKLRGIDGLNFVAKPAEGEAVNAGEQAAIAPFDFGRRRIGEFAAQNGAAGFEAEKRLVNFVGGNAEERTECARADGARVLHPSGDESEGGIVFRRSDFLELGCGSIETGVRKNRCKSFCLFYCDPIGVGWRSSAGGTTLGDQLPEITVPRGGFFSVEIE